MYDQRRLTKLYKTLYLSIATVCFLTACSTVSEHKEPTFNLSKVDKMIFKFEGNTQFLDVTLPQQEISKQVTNNLSEWGYQFTTSETNGYTHDLSIHIGSIRLGATPTGLSFSAGNSNPRSQDFQKAKTYPLTCSLRPKGQTEQRAKLVIEVMATEYKDSEMISGSKDKMISQLTDDISTTCFNLLSSLDVKPTYNKSDPIIIKHTWIPKIRIENEDTATDTANQPNNISDSEPRKRMIIHNQGSPVIFKFGSDR